MGYEFICGIPMAVATALAIIFGLFITLERLEDWAAKLINQNRRVTVVTYKAGSGIVGIKDTIPGDQPDKLFFEIIKNYFVTTKPHRQTDQQPTYPANQHTDPCD